MKTIGLLGGMSWESTALYYREINQETRRRLGGLHSAPIAMVSVDFAPLESLQQTGDWDGAARHLVRAARDVQAAGAELLLICTNTMHKVADAVAGAVDIPLLHIADATARAVVQAGVRQVGLLGTRFTMEQDFYTGRLRAAGLEVLVPDETDREVVHGVIYRELCQGQLREPSRRQFLDIIDRLQARGARGVIQGCTEITLLVQQADTAVPLFDTTAIHARAAVAEALA